MVKKNRTAAVLLAGTALFWLYGCNNPANQGNTGLAEETLISVHKDGSVTAIMADSFEEPYYQQSELEKMISEETAAYNEMAGADSIRMEKVESQNGVVNVIMNFTDDTHYADYMDAIFYMGTIAEAAEMGADLDQTLYDFQNMDNTINGTQISDTEKTYILITDETMNHFPVAIETFGKILYVSDGLTDGGDDTVVRAEDRTEALSYIIFE